MQARINKTITRKNFPESFERAKKRSARDGSTDTWYNSGRKSFHYRSSNQGATGNHLGKGETAHFPSHAKPLSSTNQAKKCPRA